MQGMQSALLQSSIYLVLFPMWAWVVILPFLLSKLVGKTDEHTNIIVFQSLGTRFLIPRGCQEWARTTQKTSKDMMFFRLCLWQLCTGAPLATAAGKKRRIPKGTSFGWAACGFIIWFHLVPSQRNGDATAAGCVVSQKRV